ncbi:MAG: mandelate racemase/muconate lactonizing enzyme family protein [Chthonomonadales bacterium]|nr:mandelate racemase/muconate lactonizing enzyme family protein [Chthonomonadales bacterium]
MNVRILEAGVTFVPQPFATPLHLSSGTIAETTEARAWTRVAVDGREAVGRGTIYLGELWSWPDAALAREERDAAMRRLCERIAADLPTLCGSEPAHPLELGLRLDRGAHELRLVPDPPELARAVCASPFDAAIHDAAGQAMGISAFRLYDSPAPVPSADRLFPGRGAVAAVRAVLRPPAERLDAWLVVGQEEGFAAQIEPWVRRRRYRCFKLKVLGRDSVEDARHTARVYRAVLDMGARAPRLMSDSNCANPDAASVLEYLRCLRSTDQAAFDALEYVEQPTARDILAHHQDWREVTRLKPVMLDEGLTGLDLMEPALQQGWSGFALKTCKGHSFSLVASAWAREHRLVLSLQDLTNPGLSAIHAALLAAHVETVNGVELNSPQFTPAANAEWLPRLAGLLDPMDGTHRLPDIWPAGLGSAL